MPIFTGARRAEGMVIPVKALKKYAEVFKISLSNGLVYAWGFLFDIMMFAFFVFVFLLLWKSIYSGKSTISGYSLNQIIWYMVVTELIIVTNTPIFREISQDIKNGNIAYFLNRPYNYVLYCFSNSLGQLTVRFAVQSAAAVLLGIIYIGPLEGFNPACLPALLTTIMLGILTNYFVYMNLALTAFWVEDNTAFVWIYSKMVMILGGGFIPLEMFPDWLRDLTMVLPTRYIAYSPANLAVHFTWEGFLSVLGWQLFYLFFFTATAILIYGKGARNLNVNGG